MTEAEFNRTKMKAVIYSRVSGPGQETENQIPALEALAAQRGFEVVSIYKEEESAWRSGRQRELARLLREAHRGRFQIVLVWALDRLSREGALAILSLVNRLSRSGVRVISYQEPWSEAPGELGELLFALTGWVARMESQRLSERTKAGLVRAVKEGKKLGRPPGSKDKKRRQKRVARVPIYDLMPET